MKELLVKYTCVIIIVALLYSLIVLKDMSHNILCNYSNYHAAIIDKINLLEKSSSRKIVLLGGSNVAFGVNSDKLHLSSNLQVVNLGLHFGTGLNVTFKMIDKYIHKGDIIILSPEYEYFNKDKFYGDSHLIDTMYYIPERINMLVDVYQIYSIIEKNIYRNINVRQRLFEKYVLDSYNPVFKKDIYYRDGFNKYGDVVSHLEKANRGFTVPDKVRSLDELFVNKLNEFKNHIESKGAKLVFTYPCISKKQYDLEKKHINEIHGLLVKRKISKDISPVDFVFEDNCFFDSNYHLNAVCREKRTDILKDIIKKNI